MKKALILTLVLVFVCALSVPALAGNVTGSSGSTIITASIGSTYTLTIPDNTAITLNATSTAIGNIAIANMRVPSGKQITVTATSPTNNFNLKSTANNSLPYSLTIGGASVNSTIFTANATKPVTVEITAAAWDAAPAGDYTDTITFTASITNSK